MQSEHCLGIKMGDYSISENVYHLHVIRIGFENLEALGTFRPSKVYLIGASLMYS